MRVAPEVASKQRTAILLTASQDLSLDDVAELIEHVEGALYR